MRKPGADPKPGNGVNRGPTPKRMRFVDVTLRDAHQCLWSTRMTTAMMAPMLSTLDRVGYDVVNVGERELNFGQAFLLGAYKKTKMDLVSANLVLAGSKKPLTKPYRRPRTLPAAVTR